MKTLYAILLSALCLGMSVPATAQSHGSRVPDSLSFQGYLTDEFGDPITATTNLTFKLYKNGAQVWAETHPSVSVANGIFNVILGTFTPLDTVAFNRPINVGITVGADAEISPRTPLLASPYALGMRGLSVVWTDDEGVGPNLIGGHPKNSVASGVFAATIGGGGDSGGPNQVVGNSGTVGGGVNNNSGSRATVGGGSDNQAGADLATVAGGGNNVASGEFASVGGGYINQAGGLYATIPGGLFNQANGGYAFAAGQGAHANHSGSFVWADSVYHHLASPFSSTDENQFLIRASGGVGINTNAPANEFHVVGSHSASASVANHVAVIDNISTGAGADVLALRIGRSSAPDTTNSFVTFVYNSGVGAGFIRGNGSGGVELVSSGSDYAEYLVHLHPNEILVPGDVVGVFHGRIARRTEDADQIMVVSTAPIVVGNHPVAKDGEPVGSSRVAFIGQAPVNVRGPVNQGDFLVPSGLEDGTAVAVSPAEITLDRLGLVFATAWESKSDAGLGKVNAAIGIDQAAASRRVIQALHERTRRLESSQMEMEERLAALERRLMP